MSPYVKAAFITTEDKRFYEHHGIDWYRVFGAIKNNLFKFRVAEGFSTITMQLARNLWPEDISGRDKTLRRKLREAHVAREIEGKYSKDKILELYLNQIDLGNRAYGVEAASQRYFGKSVRDLNVAEAATLAAIPKAPSRYNPRKNPNLSVQRRNTILNLLRDNGLLSARRHRAVEGVPAAAQLALRLQRRRRVLRRVRPAAARRALRLRPLQVGLPDLHHARPRHPAGGRAGARGAARGHRERRRRQVRVAELPPVSGRAGRHARTTATGRPRPTCRAWWSRSTPRPATSGRWWAAATSRTASSTAPPRRSGSRAPPSSRSSTPRRSRRAIRSRT